jgi:hypothetical protein
MDRQQMMDALDIIAISAIKEPTFKARLLFKYKNGIQESIDVEENQITQTIDEYLESNIKIRIEKRNIIIDKILNSE